MRSLSPVLLAAALLLPGCAKPALTPEAAAETGPATPKNVILIIGDGMGPQQIGLLELYARRAPASTYLDDDGTRRPTAFQRLAAAGTMGLSLHYPMDKTVVDSACSATQLALGMPAPSESIGVDATGEPQQTVLELAQTRGKATGLVSDTRLTHATPAAFGAHVGHRSMEDTIAEQLLDTAPDVMLSGGRRHFLPRAQGGRRSDGRDLIAEASGEGFVVVQDRTELDTAADDGKVLGLFAHGGMLDAIAERRTREADDRTEPSLTDMATFALDRLSTDDDGFFLMIESGQIDWSCHANDAGWLMAEMQRADEMLHAVLDWAATRDDTLVVVTADHETGGFGLSYSRHDIPEPRELPGSAYAERPYQPDWNFGPLDSLDKLSHQTATWSAVLRAFGELPPEEQTPEVLAEAVRMVSDFDVTVEDARAVLATGPDRWDADGRDVPLLHDFSAFYYPGSTTALLGRALAHEQNVVWATGTHTHTPVPVFAVGPGAERFAGLHHHTDLGRMLKELVGEGGS